MKKPFFLISVLFLLHNTTFAQTENELFFQSQEEIKEWSQLVVNDFTKNEIASAFDKLGEGWGVFLSQKEVNTLMLETIDQMELVSSRFGDPIGNMLVKEDVVDWVAYRLTYVIKYERYCLRLRFFFYNGKPDEWYFHAFKWDDNFTELFNE